MDVAEIWELLARGVAIGALAATAAGLWRGGAGRPARSSGVLFCLSVIGYALNSSSTLHPALGPVIMWPAHFVSLGGAGFFWLFVVTLFEDRPVSPANLIPAGVLTAIGVAGVLSPSDGPIWIAHNLIEAGFGLHALSVVARGWRGDLVEARRRLRGPFLGLVTLYVLGQSGFEISETLGFDAPWIGLMGGASLAVLCLAGVFVLLEARQALFGATALAAAQAPPALDAGDRQAIERLNAAMGEAEAWRREGLTIGLLADQLGLPEHRLRRLINDQLGHRNFAAFVNAHRIEAAKAALADPSAARTTVAAIAYDLGFGSLGPFNRAFKEATGVTPTEFRRARQGGADA